MLYFLYIILIDLVQGRNVIFVPESGMTTKSVKEALATDYGDHQRAIKDIINDIQSSLLSIGRLSNDKYKVIPIQGSDNYAIESTLRTITPKNGKVLILSNGYFGNNIQRIVDASDLNYCSLSWTSGDLINLDEIENHLKQTFDYTTVIVVHVEASSSIINPLDNINDLVNKYLPEAALVVDTLTSYGCFPFPYDRLDAEFLLVSPGRCIQAFIGVSFVIAKKEKIVNTTGNYDSFSMDLTKSMLNDYAYEEMNCPVPNQLYAAVHKALIEFSEEGSKSRNERYKTNQVIIQTEFTKMGFIPKIPTASSSVILTAFYYPTNVFNFFTFQEQLELNGYFISPVSLTDPSTFRISHIGDIHETDCKNLVETAEKVLKWMNVTIPFTAGKKVIQNGTLTLNSSSWSTCRVRKNAKNKFTDCKHEIRKKGSVVEEEHSVKKSSSNKGNTYAEFKTETHSWSDEKSDDNKLKDRFNKWQPSHFKMPKIPRIQNIPKVDFEVYEDRPDKNFDNNYGVNDFNNNWDFIFP